MRRGILFILSGPSGSGKGTVLSRLFSKHPEIKYSVSMTTREPRPGEMHGINYYFVSREDFEKRINNGELLEYATFDGNYYGTPKKEIESFLERGIDVILEIEVKGAMQVLERAKDAVAIMITPPDIQTLEKWLRGRGTNSEESINERLTTAKEEIRCLPKYHYSVINEESKQDECAELIYSIMQAEHHKTVHTSKIMSKFE
ncbi:MAG: guanylate kinase [Clostridia bacterium]|nr:guanylate kinase [Clostridia bacterium]